MCVTVPEKPIEPPKDSRRVYAECVCCGEYIRECDDCVDLLGFGYVCMTCIKQSTLREVTID